MRNCANAIIRRDGDFGQNLDHLVNTYELFGIRADLNYCVVGSCRFDPFSAWSAQFLMLVMNSLGKIRDFHGHLVIIRSFEAVSENVWP